MLNHMGLGFVFTAQDLASAKLRGLEQNFVRLDNTTQVSGARIGASFRRIAAGFGVLAAGGAAVGGAFALANQAGKFEQGLASVAAVAQASTEELGLLREEAIRAGILTQFSPEEAVMGLRDLTQAGFNAKESIQLLIPVLDLAGGSLGELGPQEAAGLAAQAMKAFGIATTDASLAVDQMLQAVNVFALSANELPLALGVASRGAQAMNQSLTETLVALGLVKNIIPGVERASTAVAVAMERMAETEVQQKLRKLGVAVVDGQGQFRSFLDIVGEMAPALDRMTEAQRAAFLIETFGREALAGVNAILTQVTNGIRTNTGETLRGADALAYLRSEFENAGGTAGRFREQMLDTFEGQKTLLRGSLQTLAIVVGEPFAQVLKPIVTAVTDALNLVIRAVQAIPGPVKKAFAAFVVIGGSVVALLGAILIAKASIGLFVIGIKLLGVTVASLAATLLPAVLILGALAAAAAGFAIAVRRDIGGLGTFFERTYQRIKLFTDAMGQLLEQGGFSGAVREELNRVENQGLKTFAIRVFQVVFRIKRFFGGLVDGFRDAIERSQLIFFRFTEALRQLGEALGLAGAGVEAVAGLHSDEFASSGARIGEVLAGIATFMTKLVTISVQVATGIVHGFRSMWGFLKDVFGFLGESFGELGAEIKALLQTVGIIGPEAQSSGTMALTAGKALGKVFGGIVGTIGLALAAVVRIVRGVVRLVGNLGTTFGRMAAGLVQLFTDPVEGVKNMLGGLAGILVSLADAVLSILGGTIGDVQGVVDAFGSALASFFLETIPGWVHRGLAAIGDFFVSMGQRILGFFTESIPGAFRTIVEAVRSFFSPVVEFVRGVFGSIMEAIDQMLVFLGRVVAKIPSRFRPELLDQVVDAGAAASARIAHREQEARTPPLLAPATATAMPAAAEARQRAGASGDFVQAILAQVQAVHRAAEHTANRPIHVRLEVDGDTLASATVRSQREDAVRRFAPSPGR
jgi:TP901 family phage tail tape measure protein